MTTEQVYGLELISRSLRLIGVLAAGEVVSGEKAAHGLDKLKSMLDYWRLDRLTISQVVRSVQTLTIHVSSYTIGPGATWNVDRPVFIEGAALMPVSGDNLEIPIEVMSDQRYRQFHRKALSSAYPRLGLYYDAGFTAAGYGTITLVEVPSVSGLRVALYLPTTNVDIQNLSATLYKLPPGYALALEYNLAKLLKDNYPGTWTQQLETMALETKAAIRRVNEQPGRLQGDRFFVRRSHYDILRGE